MSRLIRDTDLLAVIETWKKDLFPNDDVEDVAVYNVLCRMEDIINDTDEAYSAKAVVRELEEERNGAKEEVGDYMNGMAVAYERAIEIVKRGGRND